MAKNMTHGQSDRASDNQSSGRLPTATMRTGARDPAGHSAGAYKVHRNDGTEREVNVFSGCLALDGEFRCFVDNVEHALATRSDTPPPSISPACGAFATKPEWNPGPIGRGQARGENFGAARTE